MKILITSMRVFTQTSLRILEENKNKKSNNRYYD